MSDDYTPDDEDVEVYFALGLVEYAPGNGHALSEAHDGFRRWLAAHDREVRADERERIVRDLREKFGVTNRAADYLARADRIEKGGEGRG